MISLKRLNGSALIVNSDLIQSIETTPDTMLSMSNGEKIAVKESVDEVVRLCIAFRRRINFANVSTGRHFDSTTKAEE